MDTASSLGQLMVKEVGHPHNHTPRLQLVPEHLPAGCLGTSKAATHRTAPSPRPWGACLSVKTSHRGSKSVGGHQGYEGNCSRKEGSSDVMSPREGPVPGKELGRLEQMVVQATTQADYGESTWTPVGLAAYKTLSHFPPFELHVSPEQSVQDQKSPFSRGTLSKAVTACELRKADLKSRGPSLAGHEKQRLSFLLNQEPRVQFHQCPSESQRHSMSFPATRVLTGCG